MSCQSNPVRGARPDDQSLLSHISIFTGKQSSPDMLIAVYTRRNEDKGRQLTMMEDCTQGSELAPVLLEARLAGLAQIEPLIDWS